MNVPLPDPTNFLFPQTFYRCWLVDCPRLQHWAWVHAQGCHLDSGGTGSMWRSLGLDVCRWCRWLDRGWCLVSPEHFHRLCALNSAIGTIFLKCYSGDLNSDHLKIKLFEVQISNGLVCLNTRPVQKKTKEVWYVDVSWINNCMLIQDGFHLYGIQMVGHSGIQMALKNQTIGI